jgi:hypothetical protein
MEFRNFEPPTGQSQFFPMKVAPDDSGIYYHGTSRYFSETIEQQGFQAEYRFVSDEELHVLQKYRHHFTIAGTVYLPYLTGNKPITLAGTSVGALRYIDPSRKGGIAKTLLEDVRLLLSQTEVVAADRGILTSIERRFEPIDREDGIVYAIRLSEGESKRLTGCDPYHARMILPSAILCAMVVPHGFRY